jgi:hypothetical protein
LDAVPFFSILQNTKSQICTGTTPEPSDVPSAPPSISSKPSILPSTQPSQVPSASPSLSNIPSDQPTTSPSIAFTPCTEGDNAIDFVYLGLNALECPNFTHFVNGNSSKLIEGQCVDENPSFPFVPSFRASKIVLPYGDELLNVNQGQQFTVNVPITIPPDTDFEFTTCAVGRCQTIGIDFPTGLTNFVVGDKLGPFEVVNVCATTEEPSAAPSNPVPSNLPSMEPSEQPTASIQPSANPSPSPTITPCVPVAGLNSIDVRFLGGNDYQRCGQGFYNQGAQCFDFEVRFHLFF